MIIADKPDTKALINKQTSHMQTNTSRADALRLVHGAVVGLGAAGPVAGRVRVGLRMGDGGGDGCGGFED
jgi:hypothetical protein